MANRKSEWLPMGLDTEKAREAAKSWFAPFCDEMTPVEAALLEEVDTGKEKKLRVKMRRPDGWFVIATRALLSRGRVSISLSSPRL